MSPTLQTALVLVCVAAVLLVLVLIPLAILIYRRASRIARQMEELFGNVQELIHDSRVLIQSINQLSIHADKQLCELDKVVDVMRGWSERADQIVDEVGAVAKLPLINLARSIKVLSQTWRLIVGLFGENPRQADHKTGETDRHKM